MDKTKAIDMEDEFDMAYRAIIHAPLRCAIMKIEKMKIRILKIRNTQQCWKPMERPVKSKRGPRNGRSNNR